MPKRREQSPSESRKRRPVRGDVAKGYVAQGRGEHAARSRAVLAAAGSGSWDRL